MSLAQTKHTQHWNAISKKCKNCRKAIYTIENGDIYYQCSVFGTFKKNCELDIKLRKLPNPKEVLEIVNGSNS